MVGKFTLGVQELLYIKKKAEKLVSQALNQNSLILLPDHNSYLSERVRTRIVKNGQIFQTLVNKIKSKIEVHSKMDSTLKKSNEKMAEYEGCSSKSLEDYKAEFGRDPRTERFHELTNCIKRACSGKIIDKVTVAPALLENIVLDLNRFDIPTVLSEANSIQNVISFTMSNTISEFLSNDLEAIVKHFINFRKEKIPITSENEEYHFLSGELQLLLWTFWYESSRDLLEFQQTKSRSPRKQLQAYLIADLAKTVNSELSRLNILDKVYSNVAKKEKFLTLIKNIPPNVTCDQWVFSHMTLKALSELIVCS